MFYLRLLLIGLWLAFSCTAGLALCVFRWGDLDLDQSFARFFSAGVLRICGIEVSVSGAERMEGSQPCVYVANHQGSFDLVSFGSLYPRRTVVIGKKEILFVPFFGLFFAAAGNVLIDRKRSKRAIAGLEQAVAAIRRNQASIWIFPEGTRNRTREPLLPFKKGAFHMAIAAQVPIVPIVSERLGKLVSAQGRKLGPGRLAIRVLEPVPTAGMDPSQAGELATRVRDRMLEALLK